MSNIPKKWQSTTMRRANPQVRTIWQGPTVPGCDDKSCLYNRVTCPAGLHGLCLSISKNKNKLYGNSPELKLRFPFIYFLFLLTFNITQSSKNFSQDCLYFGYFLPRFLTSDFFKNKFWNLIFVSLTGYFVLAPLFSLAFSAQ